MKNQVKYIVVLLTLCLFTLVSCEDTDNIDPDQDVRASYLGTWTCTESSLTYSVIVTLDQTNSTQILINNFHFQGANENVYCIATTNNLTLPTQTYCGNTVNGSGNLINNNRFTMKYYVNNQTDIDTINATYNK